MICVAYPDDKRVILDASQPFNGYGQLPVACYNGYGHIMNLENPEPVLFNPDSITEITVTSVFITNDEKGRPSGTCKTTYGKSDSYLIREEINKKDKKDYENKLNTLLGADLVIANFGIDSLNKLDLPLAVHYDFELKKFVSNDIFYFNPILNETENTNPFKSRERFFPVEIPFKIDNTYLLSVEIPEGYQVEEIPKSARVGFNGQEGLFEYLIQKNERNLQMRVRVKINKTYFTQEEYQSLRDFYAYIEKKKSEQIVFKKMK